ncbi:multidrug transporter subunit MdtD [Ralstonia flaminis]|jgi:EmrB/QacA subfamily drug resistance transporter|uniref:Transport protein HsrA n=1 Tax=Ralstonia flaminis TaxID=3058597 RepID=A0ABN9JS16_9RALS|nr:multidrug transporter subunit MdtD [Ralstonia sp. LMG 18101]CAJ0822461.1 putative transport protein HsrA [Ralstonia sp. LMG 18101]
MPTSASVDKSLQPLLWLVAVGLFMQTLDSTIVNTALPAMARSLSESPLKMQSVIIAYTLTTAMLMPASGWLADRFGTRRMFFAAIFLFTIGSLLCAESRSLDMLIASRVVQGVGGALLMPVGRLTVLRVVPREQFLPAMSFVTIPGLIGPLIGPTLGGWLVEAVSWHWIFLINLPVGLIGALVTLKVMPDVRADDEGRFDWTGYAMLAFGMAAVSFSLDGLSGLGFQHATVLVLLIFGLAALTAYWLHAGRTVEGKAGPLFPRSLFAIPSFSIGILGNLFARIGTGGMPFLIPLLLQVSLGYSPLQAGLMMVPVAAAGMAAKPLGTWAIKRFGYRRMLFINTLMVGLTMASFAVMTPDVPVWLRVVQLALFGTFNSMQFTAMNTLTLKDLSGPHASAGNSMLSMVMMLSMSLGVAAAGALLTGFTDFTVGPEGRDTLAAFHKTFVCVGFMTGAAAWIFAQLSHAEPAQVLKRAEVDVE